MKVWKKNMLIAAGGLLAVGVIFYGIGLATGAKSINYHNGKITIGDQADGKHLLLLPKHCRHPSIKGKTDHFPLRSENQLNRL